MGEGYDKPKEEEWWKERDFWIGEKGMLHYHSIKEDEEATLFNRVSLSRLEIKRLPEDATFKPYAFSIGFPPVDSQETDPTLFAAGDEATLDGFLKAAEALKQQEAEKKQAEEDRRKKEAEDA